MERSMYVKTFVKLFLAIKTVYLSNYQTVSCEKKFAHAHVRAHTHVCDVRAKQRLKRACDVRACEALRGLASCDRNFASE